MKILIRLAGLVSLVLMVLLALGLYGTLDDGFFSAIGLIVWLSSEYSWQKVKRRNTY